jgi:hypothetical protein
MGGVVIRTALAIPFFMIALPLVGAMIGEIFL